MAQVKFKYYQLSKIHYENRQPIREPFNEILDILRSMKPETEGLPQDKPARNIPIRSSCIILDNVTLSDNPNIIVGRFSTAQGGDPNQLIHITTHTRRDNPREPLEGEETFVYFAVASDPNNNNETTLILQDGRGASFNQNSFTSFFRPRFSPPGHSPSYSLHADPIQGRQFFDQLNSLTRAFHATVYIRTESIPEDFLDLQEVDPQNQIKDVVKFEYSAKPNGTIARIASHFGRKKYNQNSDDIRRIVVEGTDANGHTVTINTDKLMMQSIQTIQSVAPNDPKVIPQEAYSVLYSLAAQLL